MKNYIFALILLATVLVSACTPTQVDNVQEENNNFNGVQDITQDPSEQTVEGYQSKLIAGSTTPYLRYNKEDYDKALAEEKVIYLYFYATWCPICKAERPSIFAAFDEMNYNNVIGFEVHYNDGETTQEDEDIAKDFGVAYQHTTVILDKNGNEVYRSLSKITKDKIIEEISKLV